MVKKVVASFEIEYLQVLDENGKVDEKLMPNLTSKQIKELYELMILMRTFDDKAFFLQRQGRIGTMSFDGSLKVYPNYNVMGVAKAALESSVRYIASDLGERGIRVNAISAGPIKTLAASGISDFDKMLNHSKEKAPLKRNIDADDVANTALFLCSDMSKNITGQVIHVDAGYSIMGI